MAEEIKTNDLQDMFPGLIQTGFTQTEDGQLQYNVDIVDEAFNTGKSPTEIISLLRTTDNKVINTPEYYKYKYASDTHPTPYTPKQIDAAIDNAAKAIALDKHYTDLGISLSQVQLYQSIEDISANHNVYMNTPTFARMGSETYLGFYNPISGKQSEFITEQMFAERMPYMIDARGGGYEKIAKPTLNEMYNMFGKGKAVVATTQDMQTGQPVLIAYDPDTFVPRDRQYSTKHGAQQMFGSGTSAFFGGIKSGFFASTGQSFIGMAQWLNDASRYDKSYLHSLGPDAVDAHIDELMSALVDQGLYGVADKLQELKGTYDVDKLNEVFNYAYSKLDYITGTNLRNKAQPIDWVKHNKNLEKIWNRLDNSKSRTDLMHERGSGALNAIVNSGETIGMIGSQIVIAYLTAGAGSLLPVGSAAAGIVGMTGRVLSMLVGTSQAVGSEFVREGIEAGIDREDLAKMVLYALPVVTLTEYGTQGYMFKGAERTMKAKFLKEVVSPELKSFASKFAGKKATDQQIKEFTKGYLKKIFANPTFQKIMDSGIVEYGKAIMSEELQENSEQLLYNIIKKNYDSRLAPEFYETGHGKWGTRYLTDNMAENFEGVFYATAITQGVSMMLPRMLRGKMGLPTHTNNDQKLRYQALRSALVNPEETYRQAYEEFSKPDGGVFGDKSVTIEHASHGNVANDEYRVPSNPVLQNLGFEEGAPISSLSEMHFIEFIETVHSYANMIENMGLNEIDKSILAAAGFDHDISLADAVDTFEKLSNIGEAIQELERENNTTVKDILDKVEHNKNLQEGETEQAITSEEQEILRLHNESLVAKKRLDYYGQMEEDTGHSAAVNDIVKRERAIISKVRAEMSRLHNIDEIDQKMKNDPEITKLYLDTYEKVANRTMRYNHIKSFLELLNTEHLRIAVQKKEMAERLEGEEAFKNMDKGLSSLLERLGDVVAIDEKGNRSLVSDTDFNINNDQLVKLVEDIEAFEQGYMAHLVNNNSTISMDQLSSLNEKYSQLAESADFMIGELIKGSETLFNENIQRSIQEMMSKDQSLIDNIVQLQEQSNQLRENLNTEIAELQTQIEDIKAKISALDGTIEKDRQGNFIPKKYTLNRKGENPAPNISISAISDESFGGELPTGVRQVKLLEIRGKNSLGQIVGEVWIQKEDGQSYIADVIFNDAELAALTTAQNDIEAKKADIRRRRQESLYIVTQKDINEGNDVGIRKNEDGSFEGEVWNADNVLVESYKGTLKEVQNAIKDYYDAELAALEAQPPSQQKQQAQQSNITVKEGVSELFESNPELANIGTPEQYSQYLDTIFPDSKVKDIVYHGTDTRFENFDKTKIGSKESTAHAKGFYFGWAGSHGAANVYVGNFGRGKKVMLSNLVKVQNPFRIYGSFASIKNNPEFVDFLIRNGFDITKWQHYPNGDIFDYTTKIGTAKITEAFKKEGYDSVIVDKGGWKTIKRNKELGDVESNSNELIIFEPEQIHILGSKQDIEGFKEFVSNENNAKYDEELAALTKEDRSSLTEALNELEESLKDKTAQLDAIASDEDVKSTAERDYLNELGSVDEFLGDLQMTNISQYDKLIALQERIDELENSDVALLREFNTGKKGTITVSNPDGSLSELSRRTETQEEFDQRISDRIKYLKETGNAFDTWLKETAEQAKEIEKFIDAFLSGDMAEFRSKYPYSYLSESNMRQEADEFLDQLKNFDSLEDVFDLSKYVVGDQKFNKHATKLEKDLLPLLAERDADNKNHYEEIFHEVKTAKDRIFEKLGKAKQLSEGRIAHSNTILREGNISSIRLLIAEGITGFDNDFIALSERFMKGTLPISEDIILAAGNYTVDQEKMLAQREKLFIEMISYLQHHKDIVFNNTNKDSAGHTNRDKAFSVFDSYFRKTSTSVFQGSEINAHLGLDKPITTESRLALIPVERTTEDGKKIIIGEPLLNMDYDGTGPKYGHDLATMDKAPGASESIATKTDVVRMALREHFQVLSWIESGVSLEPIMAIRSNLLEMNELISTAEQEANENSIVSFITSDPASGLLNMLAGHVYGIPNYYSATEMKAKAEADAKGKPLHRASDEVDGIKLTFVDFASNIMSIGGDAGVGKTVHVMPRALKIIDELVGRGLISQHPIKKITMVGITKHLRELHKEAIKGNSRVQVEYIAMDNGTDGFLNLIRQGKLDTSDGHLYIVDEASVISRSEFHGKDGVLGTEHTIKSVFNGTKAKAIMMGDIFQMRSVDTTTQVPFVMVSTVNSHLMTEQFSSRSQLLRQLAEIARNSINKVGGSNEVSAIPWARVAERIDKNGKKLGARFFNNTEEVWQSFEALANGKVNTERAILFATEEHLEHFITTDQHMKARTPEQVKALRERVKELRDNGQLFISFRNVSGNTENMIQGLREKEVYVMYSQYSNTSATKGHYPFGFKVSASLMGSSFYTAISRASQWVGIPDQAAVQNGLNTDEQHAASIGIEDSELNEFNQRVAEQRAEKEAIRFKELGYKISEAKPTDEAKKEKRTGVFKQRVGDQDYDFDYNYTLTRRGDVYIIDLTHQGKALQADIPITESEDTIRQAVESLLAEHIEAEQITPKGYQEPKSPVNVSGTIKPVDPSEGGTFEHKGETFSEGTSIVVDGSMDGTIQEVTTDGQTIEVIISTSENKTERITLSPANTVVKVETVEEVDAKEVGTKNITISVNRWQDSRGNNDGHETHWASSATLALPTDGSKTSYTPEEKIVRRAINDAVMRAASDGIIKLTASRKLYTYQGDAGTGTQYSIVLEIGDDIIDNIEKVFKGTSVEKLFSFVNSNISNQEKWEKLKELMHGNVVVGMLSDIKVPDASKAISIEKGRVNISRSSILNESAIDDVEAAKNTVKTLWNDYINKVRAQSNAVGVVDALIDEMNMNIALVEQHYALQNGDVEVTISTRGRRIEYAKNTHTKVLDLVNKNEPTEAEKSTRDTYPEVRFDKAPNSRKRLTISLHNNDTINLVVRMPYFPHDKIASQVMIKRIENDLSQPFADTTSVDAINLQFASTNIFKLLKENGKAVIDGMNAGGNPFFAELKKYIQYNVKGNRYFFDLRKQSNYATELAASKGMTKEMAAHVLDTNSERGDILRAQDNFGRLSQLFLDNLKKGTLPFYDFLEFAGGQNRSLMIHEEYHEHGMNDILDVLYTNATSINNNQFDVRLPIKGNPADAHTKPKDTGKTTRKDRMFESVEHASPATISLQEGIERVRKYLGDSYIDSGLFVTQDGYIIKPDGSYATGSLTDNILMTIAMFNGRMQATTVEHESFHLVYRNFISPEAKVALAQAAEMIAKVEGTFNPDEDIEEWMARDFAQGERVLSRFKDVSLSDGVTLWERFKNFMKGLLNAFRDLFGLRTDIRLVRLYDQIRSGEFVDMVESLSLLTGEVAYESADGDVTVEGDVSDTVTQMSNLSDDASLKNMAANNMANKIRRGLINQMRNSTSILRAEAEIRANVLHGSLYGNILGSSTYTFSEAIQAMIESSGSIAEDVGSEMVTINDGGTLRAVTVKEVVDNNMENQLSTTALDNTLEVEDVSVYIDFYRIFSDPVHTVALTQLMLPKFDLMTGMAESKTGPNWHYDWSRIKEEDYINSMQKFYLSSIPLIDVHGNIVPGHGVYLNYKTVSDILKSIGSHVSNIIQNNKFGFQEELQDLENRLKDPSLGELTSKELERLEELRRNNAIDKFTLFRTYMESVISDAKHDGEMFTDMQSTYIHSIYNYMFGERAPKGVESYALNYGSVVSTVGNPENNRYVGLLQKAELMRKDYLRTTNETTRKELGATISQMNGFLSGLVGLYSSYYVQDKLKFVFYNDREGDVKMRAINYEAKHFKDTANKIRGNQEASFMNDRMNDATISLMKNNVIIATNLDGGTIHLKVNGNTVPLLAYGATYKHNVASYRFKFVGIDGNTVNTYKGGQTGITNPTVLKERYHNLITGLKYILPQIGLGAVLNSQGNVLESLLVSQSWESVLDILDDQAMADDNNFIDIIKINYNTPIDFFADYVGALLSLYKVYATDINQTIITKEGLPITAAITMSEFITIKAAALEKAKVEGLVEKDATYDMERLVQDIDKAQGAHHAAIVERFIHNSTPPHMIRYEMYNESTEDGEVEYQAPIRFIRPEDMFASLNAVASIINKLSGFKNTSFVYNADGHQTSRSALEDSLNNILKRYKYSPKHLSKNHIVGIDGFVNSLGVSRNLGFVSYGTSKVVTSDYIQTSISLFMQELRKGRKHTVFMVPIMPASDTGKMIFARTRTAMVEFNGRYMRIDYKEAAKGLVDVMNTFKERHRQSLGRLSNTLEKLRALGITQLPVIPEYTNTQGLQQFTDPIYLSNQFIKMSLEAHEKGVWDEFNKVMTQSSLTKDMKTITDYEGGIKRQSKTTLPNFDITLQQYEGKDVWVPGKGLMGIVDGYDFLFRRHSNKEILEAYGLTETNRLIIDDLALLADNTKKVKDRNALYKLLVSKIFFNKIQQLSSMMAQNEFVQPGSMVDLERMATSQTSTAASKYGDKSYYSGSQTHPVINQPLLAFYMTTFFVSQHLGDMGIGSQSFTDFYTQIKRVGSMTTPGQNLLVNSRNVDGTYMGSVPQQSPLLFYNDLEVDSGQVFKASEDGSPVLTPTTTEDANGRLMVNALMYRFVQNSLDSDHGVIGTSHMYKGLNNYATSDGFLSQVKRADHVITGTDMQSAGYFNMQMNLFKQSDMLTRQRLIAEGAEYLYNDKKLSLYDRFRDLWNNRRDLNFSEIIEKMYQDIIELQYENGEVSERGVRAYEAVVNSLVYGFAPLSTQKGIIQSYNQVDPYSVIEDQLGAELQDNESLKIILDPSQDVTTQKLQAFPSQQESLMSYTDNAQVNQLNNQYGELKRELRNDLTKAWLDKISSQTDLAGKKVDKGDQFKDIDWTTESYDKIDMSTKEGREKAKRLDRALEQLWVYLRSEGANAISLSGQDTAYRDLLEDHTTSEQLPMLRQKLIDIHINQINKTMQGRTTGVRLTQTSGVATEYYVKNGVTYTKNDILNILYEDGYRSVPLEVYGSQELADRIAQAGYELRTLDAMTIDQDGNTRSGTTMIPNIFADIFGHKSNETLYEILSVPSDNPASRERVMINKGLGRHFLDLLKSKDFTTFGDESHVRAFLEAPNVRTAIRSLKLYEKTNKFIEGLQARIDQDNPEAALEYSNYMANVLVKENPSDLDLLIGKLKADAANNDYRMANDIAEKTVELTDVFKKSLEMFVSRVPANAISSGAVLETVAFHDGGSSIYIPLWMTKVSDSDFDIDALTAYANDLASIVEGGQTQASKIRNEMNSIFKSLVKHPSNQIALFNEMEISDIKRVGNENAESATKGASYNTFDSFIDAYSRNKAGAGAIGVLANTQTSLTYILANATGIGGNSKVVATGLLRQIIDTNSDAKHGILKMGMGNFITRIGAWGQASYDNAKENVFGNYGISEKHVNMLGVMVGLGWTNEQIKDFFNNPYVKELLDEHTLSAKMIPGQHEKNLYILAEDRSNELIQTFNQTITSRLKYTKETIQDEDKVKGLKEASQSTISSMADTQYQEAGKVLIERLKQVYGNQTMQKTYWFQEGVDMQVELERWKEHVKYNDGELQMKNINSEEFFDQIKRFFEGHEEAFNLYKNYLRSSVELKNLADLKEGQSLIRMIPELHVTASALFRTSQILKLRNGLSVKSFEFSQDKALVEQAIGMSLEDFMSYSSNSVTRNPNDITKHMQFFVKNNNEFISAALEGTLSTEMKNRANRLYEIEEKIAREFNIAQFISNMPQFKGLLERFYNEYKMRSNMFIVDHFVSEGVIKEFLGLQGMANVSFRQQQSKLQDIFVEMAIDRYYNNIGDAAIEGSLLLPVKTDRGYQSQSDRYDLKNVLDRNNFQDAFPEWFNALLMNSNNFEYLQAMLPKESQEEIYKLMRNPLLPLLYISSRYNQVMLNVNTMELNPYLLQKYQDAFKALPETLKSLMINNEIIRNKMSYRKGSIMQVIGVDYYKGAISTAFESMIKDLNEIGTSEGFLTSEMRNREGQYAISFDRDIKHQIFDHLGHEADLASYMKKPFPANGYTYKYGYSFDEKGKRVHYRYLDGRYQEYYRTSYGISLIDNLMSEVPVFKANPDDINQLKNNSTATMTHYTGPVYSMPAVGSVVMTQTGELVYVKSVKPGMFTYRKASDAEIQSMRDALVKKQQNENNMIILQENTLQHYLISPTSVSFDKSKIDAHRLAVPENVKFQTIDSKGNEVMIDVFKGIKDFENIQEGLNTFVANVLSTIDSKRSYIEGYLEQLKNGDRTAEQLDGTLNTIVRGLYKDAQQTTEKAGQTHQQMQHDLQQIRLAAAFIANTRPAVLRHMFRQKIATYLSNPLDPIGNRIPDSHARDNIRSIIVNNNKVHGLENLTIGFSTETEKPQQITYMGVFKSVINEHFGNVMDYTTDLDKTVQRHSKVQSSEDIFAMHSDKALEIYKLKKLVPLQPNTMTPEELRNKVEEQNRDVSLSEDGTHYKQGENIYARSSNLNESLDQRLSGSIFYEMTQEEIDALDSESLKRGEKSERIRKHALEVGSQADAFSRKYLALFFDKVSRGDTSPVVMNMAGYNLIDTYSLRDALNTYANLLVQFAKANNYESIEVITDPVRVYSDQNTESINEYMHNLPKHKDIEYDGYATETDLVVMLKRANQNEYTIFIPDIKTTKAHDLEKVEYQKPIKQADGKIVNITRSTNLSWLIQNELTAKAFTYNFGLSVSGGGIIALTKTNNNTINKELGLGKGVKTKVIFGLPNQIDLLKKQVENDSEYWIKNKAMPWYMPQKPKIYRGKNIGLLDKVLPSVKNTGQIITSDQQSDNNNKLNCE